MSPNRGRSKIYGIAVRPSTARDDEVGDVEQAGEPLFNICAHPVLRHRLVTSFAAENSQRRRHDQS
ncbi:MAG: hypothetical protein E3J71_03160 [Candidatus Stahlbacteria bacterium]|nr:MAG: hypothetical protein E3J71_03160 [Candidatus Stahlbacteria bacterium]